MFPKIKQQKNYPKNNHELPVFHVSFMSFSADELGDDDEEVMDLGPEENFTPEKLEDETNEVSVSNT